MDLWYFARGGLIRHRCVRSATCCGRPTRLRGGEGTNLLRTSLLAVALVASAIVFGSAPSVTAMPLVRSAITRAEYVTNVSIVCEQDGHCYRRGRLPVAHWVYGERAFHGPGPYIGPGYYGRPASHWDWWSFLGP